MSRPNHCYSYSLINVSVDKHNDTSLYVRGMQTLLTICTYQVSLTP